MGSDNSERPGQLSLLNYIARLPIWFIRIPSLEDSVHTCGQYLRQYKGTVRTLIRMITSFLCLPRNVHVLIEVL